MESHFLYNPHGIGSHAHSASTCLHNKKLFCTWYGYAEKETDKGQICLAEYDSEKREWTKGKLVLDSLANVSCGNPVIFSDEDSNTLHIFFVILKYHYWDSAQIYHTCSTDNGKSWIDKTKLNLPEGLMLRHRPILLSKGQYLIPAYDEKKLQNIFYKSKAPFQDWEVHSVVEGEFIQADMIQYENNQWQAYMRPAGDSAKKVYRTMSADNAKSWGLAIETKLNCPLSGIASVALNDRCVAVCHNDTEEFRRTPINISLSHNRGVTFEKVIELDKGDIELSYPSMIVDGECLNIVYTYNRKMIKHVRIPIRELVNG